MALRHIKSYLCDGCGRSTKQIGEVWTIGSREYCSRRCLDADRSKAVSLKSPSRAYVGFAFVIALLMFAFATTPRARAQDNGHHLHHADHYSKWLQPGTAASYCGDLLSGKLAAASVSFEETKSGGAFAWHTAPARQLVVTLSGTLDFQTREGRHFRLAPGDILFAEDTRGSGHSWTLVDDQPWRRAYVILAPNASVPFHPRRAAAEPLLRETSP